MKQLVVTIALDVQIRLDIWPIDHSWTWASHLDIFDIEKRLVARYNSAYIVSISAEDAP